MLVDINILIYATNPKYNELRSWLVETLPAISIISKVEILGYHLLKQNEKTALENLINNLNVIYLTATSYEIAIELRQRKNVSLGDSLIAASCIENKFTLVTRNTKDYSWIKEIDVFDPFEK